jgi:hypothetical protein
MSANVTPNSLRRTVRPIYDVYEEDDEKRRDSSGRKRVDVIQCLLDSSSDEIDDKNDNIEQIYNILWLTFDEICHIRYVITRTNLSLDKQYSQIHHGKICFRCRKKIDEVFFLLSLFRRTNNHEICFICKQIICEKCSYFNFQLPSSKLPIPVRIQTLIKPPSVSIDDKKEKIKKSNKEAKTICYDCLQVKIKSSYLSIKKFIIDIQGAYKHFRTSY